MLDTLPNGSPKLRETGIVNLDRGAGPGTHWVAYAVRDHLVIYFDSFGNLKPPNSLVTYFSRGKHKRILYNYDSVQTFDTVICGHMCLDFLAKICPLLYHK